MLLFSLRFVFVSSLCLLSPFLCLFITFGWFLSSTGQEIVSEMTSFVWSGMYNLNSVND